MMVFEVSAEKRKGTQADINVAEGLLNQNITAERNQQKQTAIILIRNGTIPDPHGHEWHRHCID